MALEYISVALKDLQQGCPWEFTPKWPEVGSMSSLP